MSDLPDIEKLKVYSLAGKDYLTEDEAAHYACVSVSQLRARAVEHGISTAWWMGRKVYRKAQLQAAMDRIWQASTEKGDTGSSNGTKAAGVAGDPLAHVRKQRREQRNGRKKLNSNSASV